MLIVLVTLIILATIIATQTQNDDIEFFAGAGAIIMGCISVFIIIIIMVLYGEGILAEEKIKMYQEENTKIEADINLLVKEYMDYEQTTFTEVKGESATMLVSLFPELKSDELVKQQIKIYTSNNNKIKELKEDVIDMKIGKWLLYFGN